MIPCPDNIAQVGPLRRYKILQRSMTRIGLSAFMIIIIIRCTNGSYAAESRSSRSALPWPIFAMSLGAKGNIWSRALPSAFVL